MPHAHFLPSIPGARACKRARAHFCRRTRTPPRRKSGSQAAAAVRGPARLLTCNARVLCACAGRTGSARRMANKTAAFAAGLAEDLSAQHLLLLEWSLGACARLCVASPEVPGEGVPEGAGEALVSSDDSAVEKEVRSMIHKALAAKLLALENASDLQEEAVALCVAVGAPSAPAAGAAQGDAADEQGPGVQAPPANADAQAAAQTSRTAGEVLNGTRAHIPR